MNTLPNMTQEQAYLYLDFVAFRLQGWEVAERSKHHHASKAARAVTERWMGLLRHQPTIDAFITAAMTGNPVHKLWPEDMQEEVERQINTKVPRTINEPTHPDFIKSMHEGGRTDWVLPDFLADHGRDA